MEFTLPIKKLPHGKDLPFPSYATEFSSGIDLSAALSENKVLKPMERALIPTAIAICLKQHTEAQIRPRSGLAYKHGITVLNTPGTIDADYRGEIKVLLINLGQEDFTIEPGMRIAQLVIAPICTVTLKEVEILSESVRGEGGFGSTGLF